MGLLNFIRGNKKNSTIRTASDVQQAPPQLPPINQTGSLPYLPNHLKNQQPQEVNQQPEIQYPVLQQQNNEQQINGIQIPNQTGLNPFQLNQQQDIVSEPEDPMAGFLPSVQGQNNNLTQDLPPVQPPTEMISQVEPVQEEVSQNEIAADYMNPQGGTPIQETQVQPTAQPIRNFPIIPNIQDLKLPEIPGMQPTSAEPNQTNSSDASQNEEVTTVSDISSNKSLDDLLKIDLPKLPDISGLVGTPTASQNIQNSDSQVQVNLPTQNDATQGSNSIVDLPPIPELPKLDLSLLQPMNFQNNNQTIQSTEDINAENIATNINEPSNQIDDIPSAGADNSLEENSLNIQVQDSTSSGINTENMTSDAESNLQINEITSDSISNVENDITENNILNDSVVQGTAEANSTDLGDIANNSDSEQKNSDDLQVENSGFISENNNDNLVDEALLSASENTQDTMQDTAPEIENIVGNAQPIELTTDLISASEKQSEEVETAPISTSEKKIIKSVAFLGLDNGPMQQSTGNALVGVVKGLLKNNYEIVIDSKKGYGEHISQTAASIKKGVRGIFLKPYLSSDFSLPTKQLAESFNTSEIYSDYIERTKSIFKNSQAFIFLETGGIYNISLLTTIWAVSKMYLGQNKPVILVGSFWREKIESLKSLFDLSKNDLDSIHILDSANDILPKLNEIEQSYKKRDDLMHVEKTLDMRIEGDESDYIVLP